ncbi:MAG: RimK family protein [Spirochaetia bacterium]|nr:RimK family protein [Spirochaetia bacterium]
MANLIVTSGNFRWPSEIRGVPVIQAKEYLTNPKYSESHYKVYNLCHTYRYQGIGYYVSLLAEARNHMVLPNVKTITDMRSVSTSRLAVSDIEDMWDKLFEKIESDQFDLNIYFGKTIERKHERLSIALFNLFPAPLLKVSFQKVKKKWILKTMNSISARHVPESHWPSLIEFADSFFKKQYRIPVRKKTRFDMAILVNESEKEPPSDARSLEKFSRAASRMGIGVEMIDRSDYGRISQFDGLFIRETTAVNHHTYRFAQRAEMEGLAVIDDPVSIIRCTNKVYLAELLKINNIPSPSTLIISKDNVNEIASQLHFPVILKQPDSSFSQGVSKAINNTELMASVKELFQKSDLLLIQEFMPTEFDWRIGLIDGIPIYACKYHMASQHWQVMNWNRSDKSRYGNTSVLSLEKVPEIVIKTSIEACALIGRGLYGVDLKVVNDKCYVIEVNDNPNLNYGYEDRVYGKKLYDQLALSFLNRMEELR